MACWQAIRGRGRSMSLCLGARLILHDRHALAYDAELDTLGTPIPHSRTGLDLHPYHPSHRPKLIIIIVACLTCINNSGPCRTRTRIFV